MEDCQETGSVGLMTSPADDEPHNEGIGGEGQEKDC
jgi:hypothetical protein